MESIVDVRTRARPLTFWKIAMAVFAGMWLFAVSAGLILGVRWIVRRAQANAAVQRDLDAEVADQKVSPGFMQKAIQVGTSIEDEKTQAARGWLPYKTSRDAAKTDLQSLSDSAHTSHERVIAMALDDVEFDFSSCADNSLDPTMRFGSLKTCLDAPLDSYVQKALGK